jgi:hypothetical protein
MQRTVSVSPATLPEALYRFKVGEVSSGAWSKRQVMGRYPGEAARWIESLLRRRLKNGAHA